MYLRSCSNFSVLVLVIALSLRGAAAQPSFSLRGGSGGCLESTPSPPKNLEVAEKSRTLLISWSPPEGNECVDLYLIDIFLPGDDQPKRSSSTSAEGRKHTIEGLRNDQEYTVQVKAFSNKHGSSEPAQQKASPNTRCADIKPDRIKNLRVAPDDKLVELCWDGVDNNGCVDRYELSYEQVDNRDRSSRFRSSDTNTVREIGCKTISRLANNVEYEFEVVAISDEYGESEAATTTAVVGSASGIRDLNGWTCKRFTGCQPDVTSACSLFGCTTASRLGLCTSWQMFSLDYFNREVDQWCGDECGCDTSVPLTWMPGRTGALSALTESLDLSNIVDTFNSALQTPGSSDGGGSGNIFENAQKALQDGAANAQEIFSQAVRDAIQNARDEGSLFTGGVTQAILQDTAESGVFGEAVGNFLGETIRNVVTQGINNIVNSWVGTISQLFRG